MHLIGLNTLIFLKILGKLEILLLFFFIMNWKQELIKNRGKERPKTQDDLICERTIDAVKRLLEDIEIEDKELLILKIA